MSLSIRRATPADTAVVLGFIRGLAEYEKLLHQAVATEDDVAKALFGPNPRAFCDIAEWDGEPVGFAVWFYNFSTFWSRHGIYLEDLFVLPEFRAKGVGKALLQTLAKRCVDENLRRLEWAVLDWNAPAIQFYEGQGAEILSDWRVCRLTGAALESMARAHAIEDAGEA